MANVQHTSIDKVGSEGPGLVFVVYPEAISMMTGSTFWSIIFFLMLITLGKLCKAGPKFNGFKLFLIFRVGQHFWRIGSHDYGSVR